MKSEQYILDNLEGIDLSTMAGRIKYHRIRQGISKMEVGSRIGMQYPNSYAKTYENEKREVRNLVQVQKICKVLNVDEQYIFDDYMSFLSTDYIADLLAIQERLGATCVEMDRRIGMSKGQYRKWISGSSVPGRKAVELIRKFLEENH